MKIFVEMGNALPNSQSNNNNNNNNSNTQTPSQVDTQLGTQVAMEDHMEVEQPKPKAQPKTWTTSAVMADAKDFLWNTRYKQARGLIAGVLGTCIVIFFITILTMSIERVDAKHYAVTYSPITGKVDDDVKSEGLHVKPAFGSFILWPQTYATRTEVVDCNSKDGVRIQLQVNFQYLPREKDIYELTKVYEDDDGYKSVLTKHARSAIRNACAAYTTQEFQTKRAQVQTEIYDRLLARLDDDPLKTDVVDVQLANIQRPDAYEDEVDEKESARNDIDQAQNERTQALTRANTVLLQAVTVANRTIDTAETDAANTKITAEAQANVIEERYAQLTKSYAAARDRLLLDDDALLRYVTTRVVADMQGATVALDSPTASL